MKTKSIMRPVLLDIARSQDLDLLETPERLKAGPNDWDNVKPEDFGPEHDFTVEDHGSLWIFYPCSNAAIQWCRKKLPADGPRWGEHGYVVEPRYIAGVVEGAQRDNLMSEQDYIDAMEEANAIMRQGE